MVKNFTAHETLSTPHPKYNQTIVLVAKSQNDFPTRRVEEMKTAYYDPYFSLLWPPAAVVIIVAAED